jgi:uncharacterized membrane protein YdjX (TVP38/TMEM64 family)
MSRHHEWHGYRADRERRNGHTVRRHSPEDTPSGESVEGGLKMMSRQRVEHGSPSPQPRAPRVVLGVPPWGWWLAAGAVAVTSFMFSPGLRGLIVAGSRQVDASHLRAVIVAWGPWAPAASVALMLIHTVLPFPAELLTAANGAVFGFWGGLLVSWLGAMAGACVGFAIARAVGRSAIDRFVPQRSLAQVDALMVDAGWEIALVVRLIPIISFNVINFALGLTRLSWPTFLWTTAVGILPVEIVVVAVGYGAGRQTQALPWALLALALLTAAGLAVRRSLTRSPARKRSPRGQG